MSKNSLVRGTRISNNLKYSPTLKFNYIPSKNQQINSNQSQSNKHHKNQIKPQNLIPNQSKNPANDHTNQTTIQIKLVANNRNPNEFSKINLAELERVLLAGELQIAGNEDEHAAGGARGLAIDGANLMLALLERQTRELGYDVGRSHDFLALKGQHRAVLVEVGEAGPIRIEGGVVVLNECLRHRVRIHSFGFGSAAAFSSLRFFFSSLPFKYLERERKRSIFPFPFS